MNLLQKSSIVSFQHTKLNYDVIQSFRHTQDNVLCTLTASNIFNVFNDLQDIEFSFLLFASNDIRIFIS